MDTFDRPQRVTVCECERSPAATLAQVLLMGNSDDIENKIADGNGRIEQWIKNNVTPESRVDELYLACFSRRPTAEERQTSIDYLTAAENQKTATEDLLWTLLNSREFVFNH
jgi:hypothetical protein